MSQTNQTQDNQKKHVDVMFKANDSVTLEELAKQGSKVAQYKLGERLWELKDEKQAIYWFAQAAAQLHTISLFKLAELLKANNTLVASYANDIIKWLKNAIEQNSVQAGCYLGEFYANGIGVSRDSSMSIQYYEKAQALGSNEAKLALEKNQARSCVML